jgi:hypothetical protein
MNRDYIDTLPLLRLLKSDGGREEMLSRSFLNKNGIDNAVIEEASRRGVIVVIGGDSTIASITLTLEGEEFLRENDPHRGLPHR